jgi:hypothetical protein
MPGAIGWLQTAKRPAFHGHLGLSAQCIGQNSTPRVRKINLIDAGERTVNLPPFRKK